MHNVTERVNSYSQPRGGLLKVSDMIKTVYGDGIETLSTDKENVHSSVVGMAVDYLTRFMMTGNKEDAFRISLWGVQCAVEDKYLPNAGALGARLYEDIKGLDEASVKSAIRLVTYDIWYRCPARAREARPALATFPNKETISDVTEMVNRSISFFKQIGEVTADGFTFCPPGKEDLYEIWRWEGNSDFGGYTRTVSGGDGDFLADDTLWDFKVSKAKPTSKHTLQLLMYYVMGKHSGQDIFKQIHKIGVFNPRRNESYIYDMNNVSDDVIKTVEEDVLRYGKPLLL